MTQQLRHLHRRNKEITMKHLKNYVLGAIGCGVIGILLSATNAGPALAQGVLKPIEARIINTADDPVPVVGNVSLTNAPASQPFECKVTITTAALTATDVCGDPVPSGKRLVVEHLSALGSGPNGRRASIYLEEAVGGLGNPTVHAALNFEFSSALGNDILVAGQPVRLYIEAGNQARVGVIANQGQEPPLLLGVTVIGYLVDVP